MKPPYDGFVRAIQCKPCKNGKHTECAGAGPGPGVCFCDNKVCTAIRRR